MRVPTTIALCVLLACSTERKPSAVARGAHGPLAALMTQHSVATCSRSDRTYESTFWRPPYQTCRSAIADSTESAEIDADSVVVELYNAWTVAPADKASVFSRAEGDISSQFGAPQRCSETKLQWRQADTLVMVLQIAPASQVGTEFDEGPYRMTRMARLGPLDPAVWGCSQ